MGATAWGARLLLFSAAVVVAVAATAAHRECGRPNQFASRTRQRLDWCQDCIDIVIPYVNGSDPCYLQALRHLEALSNPLTDAVSPNRFQDHGELVYLLRSIHQFAPWARYVHIVTNGNQVPEWLQAELPRIRVVPHSVFMPAHHLPTFNIYAIKMYLHRIPQLALRYVYMEDDQFFGRSVPSDFFWAAERDAQGQATGDGTSQLFLETSNRIPLQAVPGAPPDNTEWLALRHTARTFLRWARDSLGASPQLSYPSHLPFLCHRELAREALEDTFAEAAEASARSRFRGPLSIDTRLLLPYYQQLRPLRPFDLRAAFRDYLDLDRNGLLAEEELVGLAEFAGWPVKRVLDALSATEPKLTLAQIVGCPELRDRLRQAYDRLQQSFVRWRIADLPSVAMVMIETNSDSTRRKLLEVRQNRPSMFCLNDNLFTLNEQAEREVGQILVDFLASYFPERSPFELVQPSSLNIAWAPRDRYRIFGFYRVADAASGLDRDSVPYVTIGQADDSPGATAVPLPVLPVAPLAPATQRSSTLARADVRLGRSASGLQEDVIRRNRFRAVRR